MKNNFSIILLLIILLLVQCSHDKNQNNKISYQLLNLPKDGEDTLNVSFFADTIVYIPLETTIESSISFLKKVWLNDSVILVECMRNGLLMFRRDGEFLRKIGENGRGPGEYLNILHFDVICDTIYISSSGKKSLIRYTFDGVFCDEIKFNYPIVYFTSTPNNKLVCYLKEEGKVLVYNKNLYSPDTIIVVYGVTTDRYYYTHNDPYFKPFFQKTKSSLLFNSYLSDTIWKITDEKKEPAFILNSINDRLLPRDKQIEFCKGNLHGWEQTAKSYQFFHFIPFSSWIFIFQNYWTEPKYDALYLKNMKTGEIRKYNTSFIYDDIVGKQKFSFIFFIYSDDYLVAETESLKKLRDLRKAKEIINEFPLSSWINQMRDVQEFDNPILAIIKLRKNNYE